VERYGFCPGFPLQRVEFSGELPFDFLACGCESEVIQPQAGLESATMNDDHQQEEWLKLCKQAAVEQDHEKFLTLIREIRRLLQERQEARARHP
jgi:hypothetical protein